MTDTLTLYKPFSRQTVYQGLARGVDHMRIGGGKPIVVVIQLGEHSTKDEVYFEHPYAFEALIRGLVINPICERIEIQFLED